MSSALDNISSVNLLESLITNDARWSWILDEWKASNDATQRDLAKRVERFRENFRTYEELTDASVKAAGPGA